MQALPLFKFKVFHWLRHRVLALEPLGSIWRAPSVRGLTTGVELSGGPALLLPPQWPPLVTGRARVLAARAHGHHAGVSGLLKVSISHKGVKT